MSCNKQVRKKKNNPDKIYRYFKCRYCKNDGVKIIGSNADKIEPLVLEAIKAKVDLAGEPKKPDEKQVNYEELIGSLEVKKLTFYEKYKLGKITRLDFLEEKKHLDKEIEELMHKQKKKHIKQEKVQEEKLTRELMEKYIKSIIVRGNEILKIEWK